jgi:uncharacterized protein
MGADPDDFVEARLFAEMAPFHFQIEAAWHHAVWGVEALRTGAFTRPPWSGRSPSPRCGRSSPRARRRWRRSIALSFSLPNFHFHAVTAYDILRSRGVPIGKRDYEGQLRTTAG